jgi:membrane protein implicated in regulation of membrane protease activity
LKKRKSGRWHTIYSLITSSIEELAIAALLLWLLPSLGVQVPQWLTVTVLAGFPVFCYIMYRIGHPTVLYGDVTGPEAIVGSTGTVETVLPEAFIRVQGELWKASCPDGELKVGEEVTVTAVDGLSLTVSRKRA